MAASSKRRLDDKHVKSLRELQVTCPANKQCFDCHQRGPTYVNMTIGSFVCTSCSGILRGLNPPHRVKSISMASFTSDEIEFVKNRGNEYCRREWMGTYDNNPPIESETKDEQRIKDFMAMKYERKRWYIDPSNFQNMAALSSALQQQQQQQQQQVTSSVTTNAFPDMSKHHSTSLAGNQIRQGNQTTITRPVPQSASFPPPNTLSSGKMTSMDLLSDLGGDPFASSATNSSVTNNVKGGFANFDNFNSAFSARPTVLPSSAASVTSVPVPTPTLHQPPQKDKYAALADLDNLFHCNNVCAPPPPSQSKQQNTSMDWDGKGIVRSPWSANGTTPSIYVGGANSSMANESSISAAAPVSSNPFTGTNSASTAWNQNNAASPESSQGNPFVAGFSPTDANNVAATSTPDAFSYTPSGRPNWGTVNPMPTSFTSPTNGNFNPSYKMAIAAQYAAWQSTGGNPFAATANSGPSRPPSSSNPFL